MSQADLLHGAQLQLRGALRMKDFDRRRIPTRGLEAVLLPKELKANLDKIVHHEKVSRLYNPSSWSCHKSPPESSCMQVFSNHRQTLGSTDYCEQSFPA